MAFTDFIGKKIFVQIDTKDSIRRYSGTVNDVVFLGKNIDDVEVWFIEMTDKFGLKVGFSSTQIKLIDEEK
jgi:hypothetical protein